MTLRTTRTTYDRHITSRSGMAHRTTTYAYKEGQSWCYMRMPALSFTRLEVGVDNVRPIDYGLNSGVIGAGSVGFTQRAAININGTNYPLLTEDGSRDLRVEAGQALGKLYLNTPITVASPLTSIFKARRIYDSIPTYWMTMQNFQSGVASSHEFGTNLTDRTLASTWSGAPNTDGFTILSPTYIRADTQETKSLEIWGDSISCGVGDSGYVADLGFIQRAARTMELPFINGGLPGKAAWMYVTENNGWNIGRDLQRSIVPHGVTSHVFIQMCTNDIAWGSSANDILGAINKLCAQARARGQIPLVCTMAPRTNGGNTTYPTGDTSDSWARRASFNTLIRSNYANCFDVALVLENGTTGRWNSSYLGDGIHPNQAGHLALAAQLVTDFPYLSQSWVA